MGFLFGSNGGQNPTYDVSQGLPGYMAGSDLYHNTVANDLSQNSINQQQDFMNALSSYGLNNLQSSLFNQQEGLGNQYQAMARGQGPNPAQAQLAQNTGQNIAQQAALMGSARGAQSNPGLIARQAGQVGSGIQQQAVGQAATLGAQQQLAGLQGVANQQGQMVGLANQGVQQRSQGLGQLGAQVQGYQQMIQNGLTQQNAQQVSAQGANVPMYVQGMQNAGKASQGLLGGVLNGIGAIGGSLLGIPAGKAHGGIISDQEGGPASILGAYAAGFSDGGKISGKPTVKGDSEKNDTVPAMLSPGEVVIPRSHINDPKKAAAFLNGLMGWKLKA